MAHPYDDYQRTGPAPEGYANAAGSDGKETFLSPLQNASGTARQVTERLREVADRMLGMAPPTNDIKSGLSLKAVPGSVFDEVRGRAEGINDMLGEMNDILHRIERALP